MTRVILAAMIVGLLPAMDQDVRAECGGEAVPKIEYAIVLHGGAGKKPDNDSWRAGVEAALEAALDRGTQMLAEGRSSLDVVEAVVRLLEDSAYFNAGKGSVFNAVGTHELDASIMDGRDRSGGAVAGVRTVRNPISLARRVMEHTPHVLLATDGAEQFADQFDDDMIQRVSNDYFTTRYRREQFEKAQEAQRQQQADGDRHGMGTVGCVALDRDGNLAAATSTGGLSNKRFGRVGDSPLLGAGTFADNATCAVSCTGVGEDFIRNAVAFDVSARMAYRGDSVTEAARTILNDPRRQVRGGIIAIDRQGRIAMPFNTDGMARAAADSTGRREVHVAE